ncbi:disintegrin and metalloproteinase domain-containing protein 9-like isoform X2 [Hyla sarda]|nr:disintegrin and metalloproteinase domain-containing protein 9-like isoform X2 [Hyla sarda]
MEGEEDDSPYGNKSQREDSDLLPYTEDANHIVIPKILETNKNNSEELLYMITLGNSDYVIHLVRNALLTTPDFLVFFYDKSDRLQSDSPHVATACYYQGYIEDHPHSAVAINICSGLRGTMYTNEFMYIIEPDGPLLDFRHIMYNVEASEPEFECDQHISNLEIVGENMDYAKESERRTAYLELFMVVSHLQFQFHDENTTSVTEGMLELINHVNTVFQELNTQIVLVGLEIWSYGNLIDMKRESADEILSDFLKWKNKFLDNRISYDAVGLSLRESKMSSSGLARWGRSCHPDESVFISVMDRDKLVGSSATFIHYLGHVLGMRHDVPGCSCQSGKLVCAMADEGLLSSRFSDCSMRDMEKFYASDNASCLWNTPASDIKAQGGNNITEHGEECDCGPAEIFQNNVCCNPATCRLMENATCSSGPCCHECKFLAEGTVCRRPSTECDLAEYCDGKSSTCPSDVYHQDGSPCNDGQSVCYKKNCYDYNVHCQRLFGQGARVAPFSCFQTVNSVGDRFGNCGSDGELLQCNIEDVMCGQIQCCNVTRNLPHYKQTSYISTLIEDVLCWGIDIYYHKGSYVPDGALCDKGKICLNRKCVDFSVLGYDCDIKRKCSGKGVCNNRKNCHCDMEWAPPHCNISGYGGSMDSGPLNNNSFVRYISPKQATSKASSAIKLWGGPMLTLACLHILASAHFTVFNM